MAFLCFIWVLLLVLNRYCNISWWTRLHDLASPFKIMYHVSFGKHFHCVSADVFQAFWVHFVYRWFRLFSLHFHLLWLKLISISKRSIFHENEGKTDRVLTPHVALRSRRILKKIVFSKGWLCISLLCSINICFITFTAGYRYVVTKRQYPLLGSADHVEGKFTRVRDLEIIWHPIHVNLKWVPPIQPSIALENYLENFKTQLAEITVQNQKKKNNLSKAHQQSSW